MRAMVLLAVLCGASCAGFHAVERGEWQRVWVDPGQRAPESRQQVISRDQYETEVTAGTPRGWEAPPGWRAPALEETETIGVASHGVAEFTVDEQVPVEVQAQGSAVSVYWSQMKKRDEWKDGNDVTVKESHLWLLGLEPGKAVLRFSRGNTTRDIPVTVTAP